MIDWVADAYQQGIMAGVLAAAASASANTLCFIGGQIPATEEGAARHRIFELMGPNCVDGLLVLTTTLMHQVGRAGVDAYCKSHFKNLPYCSMGVVLEGVPSVVPDNERGIREVVSHLAQAHKCRRIAFVRGPLANEEAERRYVAYVESLKTHDLIFESRLVAVGNFMQSGGRDAVRQFAQIPGMRLEDLDAIVASNDSMAIGVLAALEERGVAAPANVAVTGFDDVEEARLVGSPLTTVRQPLGQLGSNAARDLVRWIQVGTIPENTQIGTELVVRRSCGCSFDTRGTAQSIAPDLNHSFEAALVLRRQHILDTMTRIARGRLGGAGADWQSRLLNAFAAEMRGDKPGEFRTLLESFAQKQLARNGDIQVCHDVADLLRRQLCVTLRADPVRRDKAEEIFYASHLSLSESLQRDMARDKLRLSRWVLDISIICNSFASAFDMAEWRQRVRDQLRHIGLQTYFVVGYAEDRGYGGAQLLVGSDKGQDVVSSAEEYFEDRKSVV